MSMNCSLLEQKRQCKYISFGNAGGEASHKQGSRIGVNRVSLTIHCHPGCKQLSFFFSLDYFSSSHRNRNAS